MGFQVEPAWRVYDLEVADQDLQPVRRVIDGEDRGQALAGLDRDHMCAGRQQRPGRQARTGTDFEDPGTD